MLLEELIVILWNSRSHHTTIGIATTQKIGTFCVWNPIVADVYSSCPDRHWRPSSLLYGYRVCFPAGREVDLFLSSMEIKNE